MKKYKDFIISIAIVMLSQAIIYFFIKQFPSSFHVIKSIINVPLIKEFVFIYDSWYPFIFLCAFIIYTHDKEAYFTLLITMVVCAFFSYIVFILYPTMVVRPEITVKNFTDLALFLTYEGDLPAANCLPSLHCIDCFIIMFYISICKNLKLRYKVIICFYSMLIVLSTLFTIQHIIEDVMLALVFCLVFIPLIYIFRGRIKPFIKKLFHIKSPNFI